VNCQQVSTEYFWNSELALMPSKYMRDPSNPGRSISYLVVEID
jgi:hypothetical protein